jgi:hypothetical protein
MLRDSVCGAIVCVGLLLVVAPAARAAGSARAGELTARALELMSSTDAATLERRLVEDPVWGAETRA